MACSPEDGKDGVNGLNGIDGANGVDGVDGTDGNDGQTGTANVVYSDWIDSEFGSMAAAEESDQLLVSLGSGDFNNDEDLILIYGRRAINALFYDISQLPYTFTNQNEIYRSRLSEGSTFTAIYVEAVSTDGGNKVFAYFSDYRYIIIPGEVSTSGKAANSKSSSIDYTSMSYEEIIAHFNIPD